MAGSSGGGAFVIVYLFAVALVAIPILTAELMLGRSGKQSPPTAMLINAEKESRSRWWSGVGWIGAGAGFLILTFYSVVGGWVLDYVFVSITGGFSGIEPAGAKARFGSVLSSPLRMMLSFTLFLGITGIIISAGLRNGIERATGILMPALFLMLLVLIAYSAVKGDMAAGFSFLFTVDFGKINPSIMLSAVGHAFFSVGVSMGLMMAYGAYLPQDVSIPRTAVVIAGADTLIAIMAGLVIFPLVFANGLAPGVRTGPDLCHVAYCIRQHAGRKSVRSTIFSTPVVCRGHFFHRYHGTSGSLGGGTARLEPQDECCNSHQLYLAAGYRQRAVIQYLGRI